MATLTARIEQDERNQHALLVTLDGETRVFSRNSSYHIVSATEDALRRDVNRHGVDVLARTEFEALPVARFRETKAGKALLLAA